MNQGLVLLGAWCELGVLIAALLYVVLRGRSG